MDLASTADAFAAQAHAGQLRKYVGTPYIEHPRAVAWLLRKFTHDDAMIAATLLHDVMEDCGVRRSELVLRFGQDVANLVEQLSDISRPEDGNRTRRKALDREHTAEASPRAKTIKALDLVHNTGSIVRYSPGFARVYLNEKAGLLEILGDASDPRAVELARRVLARARVALARRLVDESTSALRAAFRPR